MKIRLGFALLLVCFAIGTASAQVSGNCFLQGQSDHSGTKVLFLSTSASGVTDSTLTDAAGAYTATLATGLYEVSYSHDGYLPVTLPDPILASGSLVLDDVTLEAGQVIELSGYTGDLHLTTGTVVRILGFTRVGPADTLTVDPGVRFLFPDYQEFGVEGLAEFNGTEADSIIFESEISGAGANAWGQFSINGGTVHMQYGVIRQGYGLTMINPADAPSEFDHCSFEHLSRGASLDLNSEFRFRDCVFTDNWSTIVSVSSVSAAYEDALFERCRFPNTVTQNTNAVLVKNGSNVRLVDCEMGDSGPGQNMLYGVKILDTAAPEIIGCTIRGCLAAGVYIQGGGSNLLLESCLIEGNEKGVIADPLLSGHVRNNTIVHNTLEGIDHSGGEGEISNNILAGNGTGIFFAVGAGAVSYNDIFGNTVDVDGTPPDYFGQALTTNGNGDPADIYMNIFLDPLFNDEAGSDYTLTSASPCIDAGDPLRLDPDGTTADLGAYFFDQSLSGVLPSHALQVKIACSPNPFNPSTVISFNVPSAGHADLSVFNIRGRHVATLMDGVVTAGPGSVTWNGRDQSGQRVSSGTYLLRLRTSRGTTTGKVLMVK